MALRTTALTPVPLSLDGTFQQPTWGESNAPYTTPPELATGFGAQVLAAETLNYNFQQPASVTRSLMDRSVLSSEGLFTTCVVSQGAWNTLGGTLNITLTPTRIVIDVSQTGGAVLELFATLGDPEVLPALSDSYVDIKDDGTVTVVSVANGMPEPPVTADSARTYLLVTDGAQLTSAALVLGVAPFPCLGPTIGMVNAFIDELAVTGSMSADEIETVTLTTTGLATLAGLQVDGSTTLGEDGTDTLTVLATPTFAEIIDAPAGIRALAATPLPLPEGASVAAGKPLTGTTAPVFDGYTLSSEAASTSDRQIHHLGGEPRWRDTSDDFIHHGPQPFLPVPSIPSLDSFGPTSAEIDGPSVSVTLTGTAFIFVAASGAFSGTAGDTEVGIRVEVDGVDVYDLAFPVFNTDRALPWSTSFAVQEGAGTFDVKIKFRRSAGLGSVNLGTSSILAMPF